MTRPKPFVVAVLAVVGALAPPGLCGTGLDAYVNISNPSLDPYVQMATFDQYSCVGLLQTTAAGRPGTGYLGSGTLIADQWVLTAGHMLDQVKTMTFAVGTGVYQADQWISHPSWNGRLDTGYDIAMVHLSAPVLGVTPASLYGADLGGVLDQVGNYVGYGMGGTGSAGTTTPAGLKRAGQNVVDAYAADGRILLADFDNPGNPGDSQFGSAIPLDDPENSRLEYQIAPGDSGGGLFMCLDDEWVLVGVHSFIMAWDGTLNCDYGDASGAILVSAFGGWIDGILTNGIPGKGGDKGGGKGGGNGGGKDKGFFAAEGDSPGLDSGVTVPEPGTLVLVALGGLRLARRRRRR